jgi:putative ABC transport system substrate-binding protein
MKRRRFVALIGSALAAPLVRAQRVERPVRIATLDEGTALGRAIQWRNFHGRMRELGYVEGASYAVERRWGDGNAARLNTLAAELVAHAPDVIAAGGTPSALALKRATTVIPVVFCGVADPVGTGLVKGLARPEGNLTGVTNIGADIAGKWLDLIREIVPSAKSLALLTDTRNPASMRIVEDLRVHARRLGITVRVLDGSSRDAVARSFAALKKDRVDGLVTTAAGTLYPNKQQIVDAAAEMRLPAIYAPEEFAVAGGLMSYSADAAQQWRRFAEMVHQVLRGAKPAELPVEQASTFRLTVNLRAARAIGISMPGSILVRADRVIE